MEKVFEFTNKKYMIEYHQTYNELFYVDELFNEEFRVNPGNSKYGRFTSEQIVMGDTEEFKDKYEDNKNNLLTTVTIYDTIITVSKDENKVSIRYFFNTFTRQVGRKFFQKKTQFNFLTFNLNKKIIYTGKIDNYHKKRKFTKSLKQTPIHFHPIKTMMEILGSRLYWVFDKTTDRTKNRELIDNIIKSFFDSIPNVSNEGELYDEIIRHRKIKVPDNFDVFRYYHTQPKSPDYRKFKNKYIDAFMEVNDLKGDKLKRILHQINNFNISLYIWFIDFFGYDYMMGKSDSDLIKIFDNGMFSGANRNSSNFTKTELNNVYKLMMELIDYYEVDNFSVCDHIRFKQQLLKFQPVKWKSTNYDDFIEEHDEWSKLYAGYTTGITIRKYPEEFKNLVEESIFDNCYPKLLMTSDDYNNESNVQTNCVRTYVDHVSSFIISLRRGNIESTERLTIEYRIYPTEQIGEYEVNRIQTKAKRNSIPDESWDESLKFLDDRIYSYIEKGGLFLPTKEVKFNNNKIQVSEVMVNSDGNHIYLTWYNEEMDKLIDELP